MKLQTESTGTQFIAHFYYTQNEYDTPRITYCHLHPAPCPPHEGRCPAASGQGSAACSRRDEFKKVTGRKIALARAMSGLQLERPVRAELWANYLSIISH